MRLVLCNGVFDLLHAGHIAHLSEARKMGDFLVVGLTLDDYVNKPGRPIQKWDERATILGALKAVNTVFPCRDAVDAILEWKPTLFVKGGDYLDKGLLDEEIEACRKVGARITHTKYVPVTTTDIVRRIKEAA